MKSLVAKMKTKSFWVSVVAGIILILQALGVGVNSEYVNKTVESVCTLMLMLGIFTAPAVSGDKSGQEDILGGEADVEEKNEKIDENSCADKGKNVKLG